MSFTTVKDIWPGERHESLEELRNSCGSAPVVWGELCERYLGGRDQWLFKSNQLWSRMTKPGDQRAEQLTREALGDDVTRPINMATTSVDDL